MTIQIRYFASLREALTRPSSLPPHPASRVEAIDARAMVMR